MSNFGSPMAASGSSPVVIDDDFDDACSICLEPFSVVDPATVTCCKHEYHLHCILEWSQRSKECPICWQSLVLKDPASQELLAAVEIERNARPRRLSTNPHMLHGHHDEHYAEYDAPVVDDSDLNERIMRHLAAAVRRARYAHRSERQRSSEHVPSQGLVYLPRTSGSNSETVYVNSPEDYCSTYGSSGNTSPTSSISCGNDDQSVPSPIPSVVNLFLNTVSKRDGLTRSAIHQTEASCDGSQRPRSSELLAFSESLKSKLSAASSRYKDSISKGTQGFREKFLARNASVKELSKGVQREMSASIAGVARMIERLDLKSKRNGSNGEGFCHAGATSNISSKGKGVLDDVIANACNGNRGKVTQSLDLSEPSHANCSVPRP